MPDSLIKQRGEGRSVDTVHNDMACFKLGADAMERMMLRLLVAPEPSKEAQAAYVKAKANGFRSNPLKQPVPWPYFHLLNLMVMLSLSLVATGVPVRRFFTP